MSRTGPKRVAIECVRGMASSVSSQQIILADVDSTCKVRTLLADADEQLTKLIMQSLAVNSAHIVNQRIQTSVHCYTSHEGCITKSSMVVSHVAILKKELGPLQEARRAQREHATKDGIGASRGIPPCSRKHWKCR